MNKKILTGIDLPFQPSCGSMILCDDIYSNLPNGFEARFLGLKDNTNSNYSWSSIKDIRLYDIDKVFDENKYDDYVEKLRNNIECEMKDFIPDIIHIQHLSFGMALAFSQIKTNIKKVAICHGTDIFFAKESAFHKNNVKTVCNASDLIIFPTFELYKNFKDIININIEDKVKIIPWGIPNDSIKIKKIRLKDKTIFKLLYAGRITENKGVDVIIESLRYLPDNYLLTIIGNGPYENNVKELVNKYNLNARVSFFPFSTRQDLQNSFQEYDVVIIPTKYIEAFSLTAIEAQQKGLPVVYSKISGLIEVVGDSGIPFIANNPIDLSNVLKKNFKNKNDKLYKNLIIRSIDNAKIYNINNTISLLIDSI